MNETINPAIAGAAAALGPGAFTEADLARHIFPLFSKVLSNNEIYLANHSLGRPLDQTAADVAEALELWQTKLGEAWDAWLAERESFRSRLARLIGAPRGDCIVPRTSAGQGLRAVLNAMPGKPRVLSTRGEFDSIDVTLKQYAACGKIEMEWIEPDDRQMFHVEQFLKPLQQGCNLVVVSQVMFMTGQVVHDLDRLATACHAAGARLLIDAYHSIGVFPVDVAALDTDFMIGGSYKYLRGGPGAAFLYVSPNALSSGLKPLDTGWFAKQDFFKFQRPDPPQLRAGGDAFLEGTPAVLTWYQARAGQQFALAMGIQRLREYGLDRLKRLKKYLHARGLEAEGGDENHGAFLTIRHPDAMELSTQLARRGIHTDARAEWLRLSPDCLTRDAELARAAEAAAEVLVELGGGRKYLTGINALPTGASRGK